LAASRERVPVTEASLAQVAVRYLNRTEASEKKLTDYLLRWVARSGEPPDQQQARPLIEALLTRYRSSGLLDDKRLAENALPSLRARGRSTRAIQQKLRARGVQSPEISAVLEGERSQSANVDLDAARALVRRRKLGFLRPEAERAENRRRDLGVLARAGFDFDTCVAALGGGRDDEF
jgi:regulatory protein